MILTLTNLGAISGSTAAGAPGVGTPASNVFSGSIDWGTGLVDHSIVTPPGTAVGYVFSGLDLTKRYSFKGTAVRAGGFADRWELIELVGATSFRAAHTAGCLTNGRADVVPNVLTPAQVAINTGANTAGDLADWEDIVPGTNGIVAVVCSQYQGTIPGGSTATGTNGYAITALRFQETSLIQVPAQITSSPTNAAVLELTPVAFQVGVSGNPAPSVQWYRNGAVISGATNLTYAISETPLSNHNAAFTAVAANVASNVSYSVTSAPALLTVQADTTAPRALSAGVLSLTQVQAAFTKKLLAATANVAANYKLTNSLGAALAVTGAALDATLTNVVLMVAALTPGETYSLTIKSVTDRTAAQNAVPANSRVSFLATLFTGLDIGGPAQPGSATNSLSGYSMTAGGAAIGGASDQFFFDYLLKTNDFDVSVRIASFTQSDLWATAGLMARETLDPTARFAATLATPSQAGASFMSRSGIGAASTSVGFAPINFPYMFLRLKRAGSAFSGYASWDGQTWTLLGSATLALNANLYLGMAGCSHNPSQTTAIQFKSYQTVAGGVIGASTSPIEPPGASSRKTPFAITEIMYNPAPRPDGKQLEFLEVYNSNPFYEDISGFRLGGDVSFTFPSNTIMQGGAYLVLAKVAADVQSYYGVAGVMEYGVRQYTTNLAEGIITTNLSNGLNSKGGSLQLYNSSGGLVLDLTYTDTAPWPVAASGTGHSLALTHPSYGEGNPEAWDISDSVDGSPGRAEGFTPDPLRSVVINEILARPLSPDLPDWVELYNYSAQSNDISGCILTTDPTTNRFVVPNNTVLPPRGFIVFDRNATGMALDGKGATVYFKNPSGTRVLDVVQYDQQAVGVSFGRYPNGSSQFYPLQTLTPGATNSGPLVNDIVINELMYKPISGSGDDQYIELYNKGANTVDLRGWSFTAGVSFIISSNAILAPDHYLVVAANMTNLFAKYTWLNYGNTVGNFTGSLSGKGERVALAYPEFTVTTNTHGQLKTNIAYITADEVTYRPGGKWGHWCEGGGSSLELLDPRANHRLPSNWGDSDETAKAPWTTIEATGTMDNGFLNANALEGGLLSEGECLLDNVELIYNGANIVPNPNFDAGMAPWTARGTQQRSTNEATGGYGGGPCLHVRASDKCDYIPNRLYVPLNAVPGNGNTITIRYKVRWLAGWPEFLLRTHGNYYEASGPMVLPPNLGTPGQRNSRAVSNAPPAIYEVACNPILPVASQAALITARVDDPDGVAAVTLLYRLDPNTNYTSVPMLDNGTGGDALAGDGIYTAAIPGQSAGILVAYLVQATDAATVPQTLTVPSNTTPAKNPMREFLVRFGEPVLSSTFGTYRYWLTQNAVNLWINRPVLANEVIEGTFVYGNCRQVHHVGGRYSASTWHQGFTSPLNDTHYALKLPKDDQLLGTDNFNKIHAPGNGAFDDVTLQREQTGHWIAKQLHVWYENRRFVNFYINGILKRPNALMEDMQVPGPDLLDEYFPNDANGNLYKTQVHWEGDDTAGNAQNVGGGNQSWCTMNRYTTTLADGQVVTKGSRYRFNWFIRNVQMSANDRTNVVILIDTANANIDTPTWADNVNAICDMDEILRTWAVRHSIGDWDFFGSQNGQNSYWYKPTQGRWNAWLFDMNIIMGNSGSWTPGANLFLVQNNPPNETVMNHFLTYPRFRRIYMRALKEICTSAFPNAKIGPVVSAKWKAFQANGLNPGDNGSAITNWVEQARVSILATVAAEDAASFSIIGTNYLVLTNNLLTVSGLAPVEIATIMVNGQSYPIIWATNNIKGWSIQVAVNSGTNVLSFQGYDVNGNLTTNAPARLTVNYTGQPELPLGNVALNEIMYNPAVSNADFVEIYNAATRTAFDLTGWQLHGVGYTFPMGTILPAGGFLVLAADRQAFATAYGAATPIFDVYPGRLQPDGETLTLIQPGATNAPDQIISKVKYENVLPWVQGANGQGYSLQLVDPKQDQSRVCNWGDRTAWRFYTTTGTAPVSNPKNLLLYLTGKTEAYVDDLMLVPGSVAGVGSNFIRNGDFESPIVETPLVTNSWRIGTYYSNVTTLSTDYRHSGRSALHLVATNGYGGLAQTMYQPLSPAPTNAQGCTLSCWIYAPPTNQSLYIRVQNANNLQIVASLAAVTATPGTNNSVAALLAPIPPLWINEIQPNNVSGLADHTGQRGPWLELYNAGTNPVVFTNLFLTDDYANLSKWPFPAGAAISPGQFLVIFVDGHPERTTASEWHTSFSMESATGSVALTRHVGDNNEVLDYINFDDVFPDYSFGSFPDGQPFDRQMFYVPTPGLPNTNTSAPLVVFINEWMAGNKSTFPYPGDGKYYDWFELYNPTTQAQALDGFYLTDTATTPLKYAVPPGYVVPPYGFLLVWADGLPVRNSTNDPALHLSFKLAKSGGTIGLYGGDLRRVDSVAYGAQTNDVSQGRFPDGTASLVFMTLPSPAAPNNFGGLVNHTPVIGAITNYLVYLGQTLTFTATATDPDAGQRLTFNLDPGAPVGSSLDPVSGLFAWTPLPEQTASTNLITVRVTDNGTPPKSDATTFTVRIAATNNPPTLGAIPDQVIYLGQTVSFTAHATDPDQPAQTLAYSLASAPLGANLDPVSGLFSWKPTAGHCPSTNPVVLQVTDTGIPPLSALQRFTILALNPVPLVLTPALLDASHLQVTVTGNAGSLVEILASPDFVRWQTNLSLSNATGSVSFTNAITNTPAQFYRAHQR